MGFLPCGVYHEYYQKDHAWWQTKFVYGKMVLLVLVLILFPYLVSSMWLSVAYTISYYIMACMGVQLLIGYCGQITLGHAAFVAVGAYTSAMMVLFIPWPKLIVD
ncbi:MAG: branched-chain amino acid ABC transporter permease, partial [Thermodesulfobacteriota bacterium]